MKKLRATQELKDLMEEVQAAKDCRDLAIKMVFRTKAALKYAKIAVKLRGKFWELSCELHPEITTGCWQYHLEKNLYTKVAEEKEKEE